MPVNIQNSVQQFPSLPDSQDVNFKAASDTSLQIRLCKNSFCGRIVHAFKKDAALSQSRNKGINATRAFIEALRNDPNYGQDFSDMASRTLQGQLSGRKQLASMNVKKV